MGSKESRSDDPRSKNPRGLDATDIRILQLLIANARLTYHAIATSLHIAESTAHARLAALAERGVVRGYHADVDLAAVGRPIQALIQVRLQERSRDRLQQEADRLSAAPGVLEVFFLAGQSDLVVRVACGGPEQLRDFVLNELSRHAAVAATETSVILEHTRGRGPLIEI
ncbi:Lrp/AsnC family transcriptional regulator [Propionicicella superfundia]|uniref:Lrp/AsnC family transcriptional regulator n=1 Tax=Propionicicella superfundia TaxID=348582 RepID=UPI0004226757|nr:Lrp/AsnC family transcriptional regulator [Propionicicella superfundia]